MVVNNNIGTSGDYSVFDSFRANRPTVEPKVEPKVEQPPVTQPPVQDTVEITSKPAQPTEEPCPDHKPKHKRSFFQKCKDAYASFKKGLITAGEYTVATFKGAMYGGGAALAVLGTDALINAVKKTGKGLSWQGKLAAGAVATIAMGYQWFQAHLNANERKSAVDHRWGTGHNYQCPDCEK